MNTYTNTLTQLDNQRFLMDGGLETTLIFENGYELPEFAAFPLLLHKKGEDILRDYYLRYIYLARKNRCGFILESPTWRANRKWGNKLGYSEARLRTINRRAIEFLSDLKKTFADEITPILISGCIGPEGDGYHVDRKLNPAEAKAYHLEQIMTFKSTEADLISAYTINYVEEAIGITLAAKEAGIPAVISFTVETDGRLPSGQPLGDAIRQVDRETESGPIHYMINCAHPNHFKHVLTGNQTWLGRIRAVRANASSKSHAELDQSVELDRGNPREFGRVHNELVDLLPNLSIFGGCCGTNHQHVEEICKGVIGTH